jgi:hypothetical protein
VLWYHILATNRNRINVEILERDNNVVELNTPNTSLPIQMYISSDVKVAGTIFR